MNSGRDKSDATSRQFPLDLLLELAERRSHQRLMNTVRWWIGTMIGVASLGITVLSIEISRRLSGVDARVDTVATRIDTIPKEVRRLQTPPEGGPSSEVSEERQWTVSLARNEREIFSLKELEGKYRIDVRGLDGFDPVIDVYRVRETHLGLIASDDDSGGDLDSCLVLELSRHGVYEVQVQGLFSGPGRVQISLSKDPPEDCLENQAFVSP